MNDSNNLKYFNLVLIHLDESKQITHLGSIVLTVIPVSIVICELELLNLILGASLKPLVGPWPFQVHWCHDYLM